MDQKVIGVIGTGIGVGIAQVFLQAGYEVVLKSRSVKKKEKTIERIKKSLEKTHDKNEVSSIIERLTFTDIWNKLKPCHLIIESVIEDEEAKKEVYNKIDGLKIDGLIIATNTSSLSIDILSSYVSAPERFLGLHFFNPPQKMDLVELIVGKSTSKEVVEEVKEILTPTKKVIVELTDSPGFIVNRMLFAYLNQAVKLYGDGVSSKEDIDKAAVYGLNHPMGPLKLIDLIGVDTFDFILKNLHKATKEDVYRTNPLITEMLKQQRLGRKTKEGFYEY